MCRCSGGRDVSPFSSEELHRTEHLKGGGGGRGGAFKSVAGQSKSTTEGRGNETEQR